MSKITKDDILRLKAHFEGKTSPKKESQNRNKKKSNRKKK